MKDKKQNRADKEKFFRRFEILDILDRISEELPKGQKEQESREPKSRHEELSLELHEAETELREKLDVYYTELAKEGNGDIPSDGSLREEVQEEITSLRNTSANLQRSYFNTIFMTDELEARLRDVEKSLKKRKLLKPAPANSVIDLKEQSSSHFARGTNFYKLFLICFVGSFVGVVIELLWCLFRNGYIESRSGLVYGPFNLLYGAGAVALTLVLYRYRNHSSAISFAGGFIVGSALEYVCSFGQEMLLGSRSWDYSEMPFNLNGRICLLYSIFWGFLGVLWIKNIYPRMAKVILKIPNKAGKTVSWILAVFMVFNIAMTCVSLVRWTGRMDGNPPKTAFGELIDERFPDERMERIFANMEFGEAEKE